MKDREYNRALFTTNSRERERESGERERGCIAAKEEREREDASQQKKRAIQSPERALGCH
jgi:hypothetical protein